MKVKIRLSSTRKFVAVFQDDTLGGLKEHIRAFVRYTYKQDVREPLCVSLNGKDALVGEDHTPLASLGVVAGDLLTVVQPAEVTQEAPQSPAAPSQAPKPPPTSMSPPGPQQPGGRGDAWKGTSGAGEGGGQCKLLVEAVDGHPPPSLELLLDECKPKGLSGALNLVLHLTMLECGYQLDGDGTTTSPPPGWADTVAVFPYRSTAHSDFRCKLVLMDVGWEKQVMASFPEQDGEVKHSFVMQDHLRKPPSGVVAARDLIRVAQLARELRDAVLLPLQVAAYEALGLAAPLHLAGLPQEVLREVVLWLDYRSIEALACTCVRFSKELADERLWEALFKRDFPEEKPVLTAGRWQGKYRKTAKEKEEREKRQQHFLETEYEAHPHRPHAEPCPYGPRPYAPPWGPAPYFPSPNPIFDPDSPYFSGEVPHVPGVYPDLPNPLGPIRPSQPPLFPPAPARPRNPRGPRFDFFL